MKSKYMTFDYLGTSKSGKTEAYAVNSKSGKARADDGFRLGIIKWHAPWRQYCFFPDSGCVFSRGCLDDINNFIQGLMDERKIKGNGGS